MPYTNDITSKLTQLADLTGAADTYPHDRYGQIRRIADQVGAAPAGYTGDQYSQLRRIADGIGAPNTYPATMYGQVLRIADSLYGAGGGGYPGDLYSQLARIVAGGGIGAVIQLAGSSLNENSAQGTAVGILSVTGGTGTYTFTLTDNAGGRFQVAGTNGVNLQAGATNSNREAAASYNVTVHADNGAGSILDRTFAIAINDVNEFAPVITSDGGGASASLNVAENQTAVTTVVATDADATAVITYSISGGADAAKFTINSVSGVLSFLTAPDYETPTDANGDNAYVVIVQASDGTNTDTQTITVTVTDVDEGGPPAGVLLQADFANPSAQPWVFW